METALIKEFKREFVKYGVGFLTTGIVAFVAFYFNTRNILEAHESQLNQLQYKIETKADQGTIEKRMDKLENKIDYLIELQIDKNK